MGKFKGIFGRGLVIIITEQKLAIYGIVDCVSEFSGYLTEFTVIEEFIETLPGGRVATGGLI